MKDKIVGIIGHAGVGSLATALQDAVQMQMKDVQVVQHENQFKPEPTQFRIEKTYLSGIESYPITRRERRAAERKAKKKNPTINTVIKEEI
jgi:chemotaxis protein CheY-P-specific phosphatase CheC